MVARLGSHRFSGRAEAALAREVAALCLEEGLDACAFAIVAAGPNGASPHHEPGERVVGPGDGIVVDFGGPLGGYGCDVTRCFAVGDPGAEYRRVHQVVRQAQQAGLDAVRPGASAQDVDRACRRVIAEAGYGPFFVHRTGHGIGLEGHEHPYLVEGNDLVLEEGMTFSVEPGVYLPGRFGVRIEDVAVVTADGCRRLNLAPRDLAPVA
ncbi:MAG: M24 family metallopeptidase [Deferrisomatales bacterium]